MRESSALLYAPRGGLSHQAKLGSLKCVVLAHGYLCTMKTIKN
jgi:hypothetical protein